MAESGASHFETLSQVISEFPGEEQATLPHILPLLFNIGGFMLGQGYPEADDAGGAGLPDIIGEIGGVGRAGQVPVIVGASAAIVLKTLGVLDVGYGYELFVAFGAEGRSGDALNLDRLGFQAASLGYRFGLINQYSITTRTSGHCLIDISGKRDLFFTEAVAHTSHSLDH